MKNIVNSFKEIGTVIIKALYSAILPILDILLDILSNSAILLFGIQEEQIKTTYKIIVNIRDNSKKYAKISATIYQLFLLIYQVCLILKIAEGKIEYTNFDVIISSTISIVVFSIVFILLVKKNYKDNKYSYIVYAQLLLLIPIIMVYWVTYIEGRTIFLKDLNADQWIAIFNTIIIYFSGCFIGLVGMYKTEKEMKLK